MTEKHESNGTNVKAIGAKGVNKFSTSTCILCNVYYCRAKFTCPAVMTTKVGMVAQHNRQFSPDSCASCVCYSQVQGFQRTPWQLSVLLHRRAKIARKIGIRLSWSVGFLDACLNNKVNFIGKSWPCTTHLKIKSILYVVSWSLCLTIAIVPRILNCALILTCELVLQYFFLTLVLLTHWRG